MAPARSCAFLLGVALIAGARPAVAEPPVPPPANARPLQVATDDGDRAKQAMALHDEAWALYEDGHYRAAIERLEAAIRIDPNGRELVYNLALLHEKLADLKEASAYYRRYLEMETDPKAKARVQATLRRVEGAEKEALERTKPLALAPAQAPPPPPPGRARRAWIIATGGLAGAAFVTGLGAGLTALLKNPGPEPRTGPGMTIAGLQADAHAAHTAATVADVAFVAAAAAAVTAVLLYATSPPRSPPATAPAAPSSVAFAGPFSSLRVTF